MQIGYSQYSKRGENRAGLKTIASSKPHRHPLMSTRSSPARAARRVPLVSPVNPVESSQRFRNRNERNETNNGRKITHFQQTGVGE